MSLLLRKMPTEQKPVKAPGGQIGNQCKQLHLVAKQDVELPILLSSGYWSIKYQQLPQMRMRKRIGHFSTLVCLVVPGAEQKRLLVLETLGKPQCHHSGPPERNHHHNHWSTRPPSLARTSTSGPPQEMTPQILATNISSQYCGSIWVWVTFLFRCRRRIVSMPYFV